MKYLIVFILSLTGIIANAHVEQYSEIAHGSDISAGLEVHDGLFMQFYSSTWQNDFDNYKAKAVITLGINHESFAFESAYSYGYKFNITWWDENLVQTTADYCMAIEYDPSGNPYTDKSTIKIPGAHKVVVNFVQLFTSDCQTIASNPLPENTYLEADIVVERYYLSFDPTEIWTALPSHNTLDEDGDSKTDFIDIYWPYIEGAEFYDVEWTFVNSYDANGGELAMNQIEFGERDFELNNSRISTPEQHYKIPCVFDQGYVIYRVRAVARGGEPIGSQPTYDDFVYGNWSTAGNIGNSNYLSDFNTYVHIDATQRHEPAKNWQQITSYAEDGKRKDVVTYYDGSLRSRQMVTRINSNDEAIVGETKYDFTGRPVIQILPAPASESTLKYRSGFNQSSIGTPEITAATFDYDAGTCNSNLLKLSESYGSGEYYSNNNSRPDSKYVPDADGYGYTQVEYEPDNTGRIRKQSGVGAEHMLGSDHEMSYYYGVPNQEELDRLFGADVGYSKYYKKNLVVDANGQVTVIYKDAHDRIIATGFAGVKPNNMEYLTDDQGNELALQGFEMQSDLLGKNDEADPDQEDDNNEPGTDGLSLVSYSEILSSESNLNSFSYEVTIPDFTDPCLEESLPVKFYIDLKVTDACAAVMLEHDPSSPQTGSYTYPGTGNQFQTNFNVGNYTVTKELRLDEESLNNYVANYVANASEGCLLDLSNFEDYQDEFIMPGIDCDVTCEECETALNEYFTNEHGGIPDEEDPLYEEYKEALDACLLPCQGRGYCDVAYDMMLQDVKPGGQFGLVSAANGNVSASGFDLSVYNTSNLLPSGLNYSSSAITYYDEDGSVSEFTDANGNSITANQLSLSEFANQFRPSWMESLVSLHPEYCDYEQCVSLMQTEITVSGFTLTSEEFDNEMLGIETYSEAANHDIQGTSYDLTDLLNGSAVMYDPFFQSGPGAAKASEMAQLLSSYAQGMSLTTFCAATTDCGTLYGTTLPCAGATYVGNDAAWNMYKNVYYAEKQKLMLEIMRENSLANGCFSGCFGQQDYTWLFENNLLDPGNFFGSPFFDFTSPYRVCSAANASEYRPKISRFFVDLPTDMEVNDLITQGDYEFYQSTGVCPLAADFQAFIGALVSDNTLTTSGTPISNYPAFTLELYNALNNVNGVTPSTYIPYVINASATPSTLTLTFAASGVTNVCSIALSAPVGFSWNNYGSTWKIEEIVHLQNGQTFTVWIDDDLNSTTPPVSANFSVTSCFNLDNCQADFETWLDNQCEPNQLVVDIMNIMNFLSISGDLSSATLSSNAAFTPYLGEISSMLGGGTISWSQSGFNYQISSSASSLTLNVTLGSNTNGGSSYYLFTDIAPNPNSASGTLSYILNSSPGTVLTTQMDISLSNNTVIPIGECGVIESFACSTQPAENRRALEALFNKVLGGDIHDGDLLNAHAFFSNNLLPQLGSGAYYADVNLSTLPYYVNIVDDQNNIVCEMPLEMNQNWSSFPISNIFSIKGLYAQDDIDNLENGVTYDFTMYTVVSGVSLFISGNSCFPIINCDNCFDCAQDAAGSEPLAGNEYDEYVDLMNGIGATPILSESQFYSSVTDVLCYRYWRSYIYGLSSFDPQTFIYAENYCLDCGADYATYVNRYGDANAGGTYYISENVFMNTPTVQLNSYAEYRNYSNDSPMLTLEEFISELPVIATCVDAPIGNLGNTEVTEEDPCAYYQEHLFDYNSNQNYEAYLNLVETDFRERFIAHFLETAVETFERTYTSNEYQYTLYYYDLAGNRIQTVPPQGVHPLALNDLDDVATDRAQGTKTTLPSHTFKTRYYYNTLNNLVSQTSPDVPNPTHFYYDALGRIVVAQDPEQQLTDDYSYTLYDELGRVVQAGVIHNAIQMTQTISGEPGVFGPGHALYDWIYGTGTPPTRAQVTQSFYDVGTGNTSLLSVMGGSQDELRNRIAYTTYEENYDFNDATYDRATHYSYDVHGNVKKLVKDNPALDAYDRRFILMEYTYDLVGGNVRELAYQPGKIDAQYHRYLYDADNRVTASFTSNNYVHWDEDSKYFYYAHGPLQRTELGNNKVQGIDFAYTIQGWLKGVNSASLDVYRDQGKDAYNSGVNVNRFLAPDQFGFTLGYYFKDYKGANIATNEEFEIDISPNTEMLNGLYNGNIRHMVTSIREITNGYPQAMVYKYDQLNRLQEARKMDSYDAANHEWDNAASVRDFGEKLSYDQNGNILSLQRYGDNATQMDDFMYQYDGSSNKLQDLDEQYSGDPYTEDIEGGAIHYEYDQLGRLTLEMTDIQNIYTWNDLDKVRTITKDNDEPDLEFIYDELGMRVEKIVKTKNANGTYQAPVNWEHTYYIYDAGQNLIATYFEKAGEALLLTEQYMYGSKRLGSQERNIVVSYDLEDQFKHVIGLKSYELSNHLGNVLVTVSDARIAVSSGGTIAYHEAKVQSWSDYYPFGMQMPDGRHGGNGDYRFGFNGQEKVDEISGSGNHNTAMFWEYDTRLGRRWNQDPKPNPSISNYAAFALNPIMYSDVLGDTVAFLIAPKGAQGMGHFGAIIQDEKGTFYYITQGAAEDASVSKYASGTTKAGMTLHKLTAKDVKSAFKEVQAYDTYNSKYEDYVVLNTSTEQDKQIYENAVKLQSDFDTEKKGYNLIFNNCVDACQTVVQKKTGIDLPLDTDPRPNKYYQKLEKKVDKVQKKVNKRNDRRAKKAAKKTTTP